MNNLSSRASLYDVLAMIIPGFLLILLPSLVSEAGIQTYGSSDNWALLLFLFVLSYLTGLIWNKLMEGLFGKLNCRNNAEDIRKAAREMNGQFKKDGDDKASPPIQKMDRREYYKAYYLLMKNGSLNSIPALEAQVAFIRNLLLVVPSYVIALCCCGGQLSDWLEQLPVSSGGLAIFLLAIWIGMIVIRSSIQDKIYGLVWEGYIYLKENENRITENFTTNKTES